ncbi:unnamed protein product [Nesidiocoris tenuis]|uniref:Uncharacterized protein n=1 Tax=Nesidiocoris tenuis TaxID=355587 RepID=A0A6H5H5D9_9HEMI|nr:unnamed protein product [Nesidiocoris tenuis]
MPAKQSSEAPVTLCQCKVRTKPVTLEQPTYESGSSKLICAARSRFGGPVAPGRTELSQSKTRSPRLDTAADGSTPGRTRFDCQIFQEDRDCPAAPGRSSDTYFHIELYYSSIFSYYEKIESSDSPNLYRDQERGNNGGNLRVTVQSACRLCTPYGTWMKTHRVLRRNSQLSILRRGIHIASTSTKLEARYLRNIIQDNLSRVDCSEQICNFKALQSGLRLSNRLIPTECRTAGPSGEY